MTEGDLTRGYAEASDWSAFGHLIRCLAFEWLLSRRGMSAADLATVLERVATDLRETGTAVPKKR
jgi:hypothetical protein